MNLKILLRFTALAEGGLGLALLLMPALPSGWLFGQTPTTALAVVFGRFGGVMLLTLTIVWWFAANDSGSPASRGAVRGMLFYDLMAAMILTYARLRLGIAGPLLWIGVALHIVLAAWCVREMQRN